MCLLLPRNRMRCARDADLTILFWSREAACSDWTRLEWTSVTACEISESRTCLKSGRPAGRARVGEGRVGDRPRTDFYFRLEPVG